MGRQHQGIREHHHHYHQSLNREGCWGTKDDFATSFLHISLFSTALWDLVNSRPVHSLMLSSHLFLYLPCLLPPFTVPCKMVLVRPDIENRRKKKGGWGGNWLWSHLWCPSVPRPSQWWSHLWCPSVPRPSQLWSHLWCPSVPCSCEVICGVPASLVPRSCEVICGVPAPLVPRSCEGIGEVRWDEQTSLSLGSYSEHWDLQNGKGG